MNIISGNYGDGTVALIQWAHENALSHVFVVNITTGWEEVSWHERVEKGKALATQYGFTPVTLVSKPDFLTLMKERGEFPQQKFQWCAGILKGLPLLEWLDKVDPQCQATMILPKRRSGARVNMLLQERIAESEHHGDRALWHPLCETSEEDFKALIQRAGFEYLHHRSLECSPCVNSTLRDMQNFSKETVIKTALLEKSMGKPFFKPESHENAVGIDAVLNKANMKKVETDKEEYQLGCGTPFGCGDV